MNQNTQKRPDPIAVARGLFFLNAAIWILFGVLSLTRPSSSLGPTARWIIAVLMLANAGAMAWVGAGLGKRRSFYYLGLAVMAVNIILTVTDQVGVSDLITLVIDLAIVVLLIATRSRTRAIE
jgi:hypothetical protein